MNDPKEKKDIGKNIRLDTQCYILLKKMKAERRARGVRMGVGAIVGELVSRASEGK
jgi:hypothetical protein